MKSSNNMRQGAREIMAGVFKIRRSMEINDDSARQVNSTQRMGKNLVEEMVLQMKGGLKGVNDCGRV